MGNRYVILTRGVSSILDTSRDFRILPFTPQRMMTELYGHRTRQICLRTA
nr:MAG TPA: hypothetical protein [Caudoviricetes sp.]